MARYSSFSFYPFITKNHFCTWLRSQRSEQREGQQRCLCILVGCCVTHSEEMIIKQTIYYVNVKNETLCNNINPKKGIQVLTGNIFGPNFYWGPNFCRTENSRFFLVLSFDEMRKTKKITKKEGYCGSAVIAGKEQFKWVISSPLTSGGST